MAAMPPPNPPEKWKANLNVVLICKDCKETPPNLVDNHSSGDTICGSCGLVLGERIIDTRSEWRTFSNDDQAGDDPSRVGDGGNPLLNGSQLSTTISFGDGGLRNRDLARAQSKATHDKANKNLLSAYKEISAHCEAITATKNVADLAKYLFKTISDAGAFKGKSTDALIAGCIFIACRQCKAPRTFKEVFALTKVPKAEIGRVFKGLEKFFASQNKAKTDAIVDAGGVAPADSTYVETTATSAKDLCTRYCSQLRLDNRIIMLAEELAAKTQNIGSLAGRSPLSVAAACIYMASYLMGDGKPAKDIAPTAGVSDGTIRTSYKLIYPERETLIDKKWLQPGKGDMKRLPPA